MTDIYTKTRSNEAEIMDKFDFKGKELKKVLSTIDEVNKKLGGHRVTIKGVKELLSHSKNKNLIIADLGCGSGDALRQISRWARQQHINVQLIGIDANPHTIAIAREWSQDYKNISYRVVDVFSEDFDEFEADIITCCLTLHHFDDESIKKLLPILVQKTKLGVVINDLQRTKIAYQLFKLYCKVFVNSEIS